MGDQDRDEGPARLRVDRTDLAELTWAEFQARLTRVLGRMATRSSLILAVGNNDSNYFVQFRQGGRSGLRAEAVGNEYLEGRWALSPDRESQLAGLGWRRPSRRGKTGRNFTFAWSNPAPHAEIASLAVRTLREVYDVARPADLVYRRFSEGGPDFAEPSLGIDPERDDPPRAAGRPARATAELLEPLVEASIMALLGTDVLVRDRDGDIPIRMGSAITFVRVIDGAPPVVRVFSPVLRGVESSLALLQAIDQLNARIMFGRVFWHARQVIVATELPAVGISADQIAFACLQVGTLADHLDDVLGDRFGGTKMFAETPRLLN